MDLVFGSGEKYINIVCTLNLFVIKVCLYKFQEYCQLVPNEVCNDIVKEYPSLTIANECQYVPRQTCSEDDVKPKEVIKPVIKKVKSCLLRSFK